MLKSMTGYGAGEYLSAEIRIALEIKSVNNRYRDVVLRAPKMFQPLEEEIRSRVASRVARGRVEVSIQVEKSEVQVDYDLTLNVPLVKAYMDIFDQLEKSFGVKQEVNLDDLWKMKDVLTAKPRDIPLEGLGAGLFEALDSALDSHEAMRIREGRTIEEDLFNRLDVVGEHLKHVEERAPIVVEEYRKRLREKVEKIADESALDENRLVQETAYFADRSDITEETVRTRSHLSQLRKYAALEESVGRRLDFLLQEINREVNTMSAKASDSVISIRTVEIKAELEKIREQIQNVE